jgi:DNA-binding transcriptional LysR family regulator
MDSRHFRYFIAAAEELHFARAAERLGVAQPAMSQQIRSLEDQLGVRLFSREKKRVELTEAGAAFLIEARAALASLEKAVRVAQDTARGELGRIIIGFVGSAMYKSSLPEILKAYRTKFPCVELVLEEMGSVQQLEFVESQHIDIAILRDPPPELLPKGLASFELARHKLVAVLPSNHPLADAPTLALSRLAHEPFLALDDRSKISLAPVTVRLCREAGFEPDIRLRLSQIATLIHLVGAGHGVSIIPDLASYLNLPDVHFIPLSGPESYSRLVLVHRRYEHSESVKSLLALIRKSVPL